MLREKLGSIPEHLSNSHVFPDNTEHKKCCHGLVDGERDKAWMAPDSLVNNFVLIFWSKCEHFHLGHYQSKKSFAWVPELKMERLGHDDTVYTHRWVLPAKDVTTDQWPCLCIKSIPRYWYGLNSEIILVSVSVWHKLDLLRLRLFMRNSEI